MKALFGALLCFVLAQSQAWAISGGPVFSAGTNIVGTYAGVMEGAFDPTNPRSQNTLGIFSLGIPQSGLASGNVAIFTGERTFVGSIQGVGDPNSGSLQAAIQAIPVVTGGGETIFTLNFHADGILKAKVKNSRARVQSLASTRLAGTAVVTTTNRNVTPVSTAITNFDVEGFKQSNSATTTAGTGASSSPSGGQ